MTDESGHIDLERLREVGVGVVQTVMKIAKTFANPPQPSGRIVRGISRRGELNLEPAKDAAKKLGAKILDSYQSFVDEVRQFSGKQFARMTRISYAARIAAEAGTRYTGHEVWIS